MKKRFILAAAFAIGIVMALAPPSASVDGTSASVAVSITVASFVSISIHTDASALGNSSTSSLTAALGTLSAYGGSVPTGVTRAVNGSTNWSVSTPFDVLVGVANQSSSNYTLTGQLQASDSTNTWQIGATTVSLPPRRQSLQPAASERLPTPSA